jgi:predicted nucleic acid-binding protein
MALSLAMNDRLREPVFLDTAYVIALVNRDDALHPIAIELADRLEGAYPGQIITSRPILLEIGNGLSKPTYRRVAGNLLASIGEDPAIEVVELSESLYAQALALYGARPDKGWGMTDCTSFVIMREREIVNALTHDVHFEQAGFRPLMREPA